MTDIDAHRPSPIPRSPDGLPLTLRRMYHHSRQTFLSLTAQRARQSSTRQALFDELDPTRRAQPVTPVAPSPQSAPNPVSPPARGESDKLIRFTELDDAEVGTMWADLRRSLGER